MSLSRHFAGRPTLLVLHFSLLLILAGALVTSFSARKGTLHLREGESANAFESGDGSVSDLPFSVELEDFEVLFHSGTNSPADFRSRLRFVKDGTVVREGEIRMNRILSCKGYRFYQTDYDSDEAGVTFTVSHDPVGIAVIYTGYALLLLGLLCFFLTDRRFKRFFGGALRYSLVIVTLLSVGTVASAAAPKTLPKESAEEFGRLYVLYHGRICPLQTLAKDFTVKLYGSSGVKGLTDEQVLTGWMFHGTSWKDVPMHNRRKAVDAVDKDATLKALYSGDLLKIYPLRDSTGRLGWYSQSDRLPSGIPDEEWLFVRKSMDYIFELVVNRDYARLSESLEKLRRFQESSMGESAPPTYRVRAERLYNALPPLFPIAGSFLLIGLVMLAFAMKNICRSSSQEAGAGSRIGVPSDNFRGRGNGIFRGIAIVAALVFFAALTALLALLWAASGHIPFSNGAETMLAIAWTAMLAALLSFRRFPIMLPFGIIVASLASLVSAMGNANPAVTQLMPVLSSPLLSVHVSLMMLSYTILAVIMVNGTCGLAMSFRTRSVPEPVEGTANAPAEETADKLAEGPTVSARMAKMSEALMYPALFFLGSGIITGSIWANVSWGCYWNWDPKETWALITFLIASLGVHRARLAFLRSPRAYHIYTLILSASVLFTYFGVNYLLGGMHSYA